MKINCLMLLLSLGLLSVAVQGFSLEGLEKDLEGEVTTLDEAIHNAHIIRKISALIDQAEQFEASHNKKRFIQDFFSGLKDAIAKVADTVKDVLSQAYLKAKDRFKTITNKLPFKDAVDRLVPFLTKTENSAQCQAACEAKASKVLGPVASLGGKLCLPVCHGALAELARSHKSA